MGDYSGWRLGTTAGDGDALLPHFQREPFRRLIVNSVLWFARVDVPEQGAGIDLPASQLALHEWPEKQRRIRNC